MTQEPPANPPTGQSASNNTGPVVQIGGHNTAPIIIPRRPKLPVWPVLADERRAATDPLWAHTPTPQRASDLLAAHGLAVIVGEPGTGRRISAVRALQTTLQPFVETPQLFMLSADWDEDETPDREVFPEPLAGYGYLIDATTRTLSADAAYALTTWAEEAHEARACVVITANPRDWQGDSRFEVNAIRPDAVQVARNHLTERLDSADQAQWLRPEPAPSPTRSLLRGQTAPPPTAGCLSDLVTRSVSPFDAVAIAERLSKIDPERLARAIAQRNDPATADRGRKEFQRIRDEVRLWTDFLEHTLAEGGTRGQDRVMLLAAAYLEDAPLELCIEAASAFGPAEEQTARRYREGRSPRRRMRDVGVDVTTDDRAAFESRPGLAHAAIRTDWHHWANERDATKNWLKRITAPDGIASAWTRQIGERLLELSRTAVNPPLFDVLAEWAATAPAEAKDRIDTTTQLLTQAATTDELTRATHKILLEWATQKSNPRQRAIVAKVCSGPYGKRWPHRALVRLRHILAHNDDAAAIAATALVTYAAHSADGLSRVITTIENWFDRYPASPAGARSFLALVDPSRPTNIVGNLLFQARESPSTRDFLITGWQNTLRHPEVHEDAHRVLLAWAQGVHEAHLARDVTFRILTDVRNAHTPVDAMSRFLYGNPDKEDPALIEARLALASLQGCSHTQCSRPDCPLTQSPSTHTSASATEEADGSEQ